MADYSTFNSFWKAFKKAIPNFDETKCHFEKGAKLYRGGKIKFTINGELRWIGVSCSRYEIERWKNYFIDFFNTGEFDNYSYWKPYTGDHKDSLYPEGDKTWKFKFSDNPKYIKSGGHYYSHTSEFTEWMGAYRLVNGDCGFVEVGKPEDTIREGIDQPVAYTIKDLKNAWVAADNYREQLDRINNGNSNYDKPTYPNKRQYFAKIKK